MRRRVLQALQCLFTLAAAGCSDTKADGAASARVATLWGERVEVTNTGVSSWTQETAWRVEEDLRLGTSGLDTPGGDDPERFGEIGSILSDSRGMIYVLDLISQEIRVFHPAGTFSHTIGRKGPGPGELSYATGMAFGPGDTLWVMDVQEGRYSAFAPDGTFLRSHPRRIQGYVPSSGTFLSDGRYVDWGLAFPEERFGPRVVYQPIRLARGFEPSDSLSPLEFTYEMLPSGRAPQMFFSGLAVAVDRSGNVWFANTHEYRIHRRSLEGDTTLAFSLPARAAPLGEAEREYVRTTLARLPALLSEYLDALPQTKPIVRRILPDQAGHIFVLADVAGESAGTVVDVFRESGEYLGRLTLPTPVALVPLAPLRRVPVVHATAEHLLVVIKDELDVLYVSRLRIVKGR